MKKTILTLVMALLAITVVACAGPGDDAGTKFADVLDKHAKKVEDGNYDSEAFLKEIRPVAEEIKTLRQANSDKKLVMSEDVMTRYEAATKSFIDTATKVVEKAKEDGLAAVVKAGQPIRDFEKVVKMMGGESGDETYEEPKAKTGESTKTDKVEDTTESEAMKTATKTE